MYPSPSGPAPAISRSHPSSRVFDLRISALASLIASPLCLVAASLLSLAQQPADFGGAHSFGIFATYSPDSSHILIGDSGQRRTWTAGIDYTHRLHIGSVFRLDYEALPHPLLPRERPHRHRHHLHLLRPADRHPAHARARHPGQPRRRSAPSAPPTEPSPPSTPPSAARTPTPPKSIPSARASPPCPAHRLQPTFALDLGARPLRPQPPHRPVQLLQLRLRPRPRHPALHHGAQIHPPRIPLPTHLKRRPGSPEPRHRPGRLPPDREPPQLNLRPHWTCHSERSEESPHFLLCATSSPASARK